MSVQSLGDLTTPGARNPLLIAPEELDRIERRCPLTDEERAVLRLRARGYTLLEISFIMADRFGGRRPGGQYSDRTVDRRIRSIKDKLAQTGD